MHDSSKYQNSEKKNSTVLIVLPIAIILILGLSLGIIWIMRDSGDKSGAQNKTVASATASRSDGAADSTGNSESAQATEDSFKWPKGAIAIPGSIDVRVGSSDTSKAFALMVGERVADYLDVNIDTGNEVFRLKPVYSFVTGKYYVMTCERSGHLSKCTGGNNAVVWVRDYL